MPVKKNVATLSSTFDAKKKLWAKPNDVDWKVLRYQRTPFDDEYQAALNYRLFIFS